MKNEKTYELVLTALFTAIIVIMAFTPLGYIPLVVINATIIHIPVILGALFLGPKKGAFLGFVFAAPGAVYTYANYMNDEINGKISIAGPIVNIIIALIFLAICVVV